MPTDTKEVATKEKLRKWKYLDNISKKTCQDDNIKVGILIGTNCSKAIEPERGQHTFGKILGWCIVGSLGGKMGQPSLHCNIIKCSSVSTNQMAKHFLAVETQVEDIGIKLMLQNLYNEEFNEVQPERKNGVFGELENLYAEDKQFMMMMENRANL